LEHNYGNNISENDGAYEPDVELCGDN
jgi:hypothetical protein